MKRFTYFAVVLMMAVMAFGIGIHLIFAATKTDAATTKSAPANLQPATGQQEYRAMDGTTPTAGETTPAKSESAGGTDEANAGLAGMFGLNWKLFLAQLINFGIILFVLWKWVFGPVTKGLSDRTKKIEDSLTEAQRITEERENFDSWKQGEISQVRAEAASIVSQAKHYAEKVKAEILEGTKGEQAKIVQAAQIKLEQDKQAMLESAKTELAGLVISATEKVLKQKLDAKKDTSLIEQALKEAKTVETKGGGRA